ncbi:MAG: hypothetical protein K9M75_07000 [Phycisphaerae bacterium]|nr:hypothetical protein [Phycisphaerae bacterium]
MSRKRSRKVLYEVSNEVKKSRKSRPKLEISRRAKAFTKKVTSGRAVDIKEKSVIKPVGFKRNAIVLVGRLLNFSVKKAVILLVIFAAVVLLWPSGGNKEPEQPGAGRETEMTGNPGSGGVTDSSGSVTPVSVSGENESEELVDGPPKDHYIIIASHKDIGQLEPVAKYFSENGIETEYRMSGSWHQLITKERYLSTRDLQSNANRAKKRIIEIGDEYKPPAGFGSFTFDSVLIKKVSGE